MFRSEHMDLLEIQKMIEWLIALGLKPDEIAYFVKAAIENL